MKYLRLPLFALLSLGLFLAGCATGAKPGGITVTAVSLQVSPTDLRVPLMLHFANENVVPLGYSSSVHKLYLNGSFVGKAVNDQPIGLPPMNAANREVYLQLDNAALARQLAAGGSRPVHYRIETVLHQTVDEDKLQIKTASEGSLELRVGPN